MVQAWIRLSSRKITREESLLTALALSLRSVRRFEPLPENSHQLHVHTTVMYHPDATNLLFLNFSTSLLRKYQR
jgi:hypothetical protein